MRKWIVVSVTVTCALLLGLPSGPVAQEQSEMAKQMEAAMKLGAPNEHHQQASNY